MSPRPDLALPPELERAVAEQPAARAALAAALAGGPRHAYALVGPAGTGKREVARILAAELLAERSEDPERTRRRVLADPSPHPDLAWIRPPGNQHLVEEIRERVIGAVAYRPFEGERRVFVIERAEALAEESQNALLKTLEEPPPYAHLLLVSSEPTALLETVRSRLTEVGFAPLTRQAVEVRLAAEAELTPEALSALAALADGDLDRGRFLASAQGRRLRELAEACSRAALAGELVDRPWRELLEIAAEEGASAGAAVQAAAEARAEELGDERLAKRIRREATDAAKRADRRARTETIDAALGLVAAWFIDLLACAEGAPEQVRNLDRRRLLESDAVRTDPSAAGRCAEAALQTRRRLTVNVQEELALESLFHGIALQVGER